MYGRIIICEVVRHRLDLFLYFCSVCTFLKDNKALSCVLLSCGQYRIFSVSYCLERSLYRNCVLFSVFYAFDPADGIGMSLADALAPERIVMAVWQDRVRIHAV